MKSNTLFGCVVFCLSLMMNVTAMASPCDNTSIEIYNQTKTSLMVINSEARGSTIVENIGENDVIPAGSERVVTVHSGAGTNGDAKGVITLINQNDELADVNHKFIALKFDFSRHFGLSCSREAEVINANNKNYSTYLVSGYSDNVKLFVVGK